MNQRHLYMSLVELIKEILLRKQYFRQKFFDNGHIIKQHTKFTINMKKKRRKKRRDKHIAFCTCCIQTGNAFQNI